MSNVEAQLTELEPGVSNNEYWVVASSAFGTIESAHQTFATLSAPSIENESVSHLTQSDATLEATINPEDARSAYYQFQLVANPSEYLSTFACPSGQAHTILCELSELDNEVEGLPLGKVAGFENQTVSLDLASAGVTLQPGTTYHYRVITAREAPTKRVPRGKSRSSRVPIRHSPLPRAPDRWAANQNPQVAAHSPAHRAPAVKAGRPAHLAGSPLDHLARRLPLKCLRGVRSSPRR